MSHVIQGVRVQDRYCLAMSDALRPCMRHVTYKMIHVALPNESRHVSMLHMNESRHTGCGRAGQWLAMSDALRYLLCCREARANDLLVRDSFAYVT